MLVEEGEGVFVGDVLGEAPKLSVGGGLEGVEVVEGEAPLEREGVRVVVEVGVVEGESGCGGEYCRRRSGRTCSKR